MLFQVKMLLPSSLPSSIGSGKPDFLCDWMGGSGTREMLPKCDELHDGCQKASLITEGNKNADNSLFLDIPISCSELSSVSVMPECCAPRFVYKRRKHLGNYVAKLSADTRVKTQKSVDSLSAVSSEAPLVTAVEQHIGSIFQHESAVVGAPIVPLDCSREPNSLKFESTNACSLVEDQGTKKASKIGQQRIILADSVNDSCSSSRSNMELISVTKKTGMDEVGECSSSSIIAVDDFGKDISGKDRCISILRSQGLLERVWPFRPCASSKDGGVSSGRSCSRACKICSLTETTLNMLICDYCEEAFHLSCHMPRIKTMPIDEWFCHSCSTKKQKTLKETISRKFPNIDSEMRQYRNASSQGKSDLIALMMEDTELYTPNVRFGKGFQADVPDWLGPIENDVDTVVDYLEMGPSDCIKLEWTSDRHPSRNIIGNWLQCQQIRDGPGADSGTICGKWRRAPLFEVQTDNWECFCSVLWDPTHADCAVPQELETDEVLKQLKYIKLLMPQLDAKRRRLNHSRSDA